VTASVVSRVYTLTPTTIGMCSFTPDFQVMSKNDFTGIAHYRFRWTTTCTLPSNIPLTFILPLYTSNARVAKYELNAGPVVGRLVVVSNGTRDLTLRAYDQLSPGTYDLSIFLEATYTLASTTMTVQAQTGTNFVL
jgi:hypothetical protein